jgi:sugar O-acyltransferase (sialic acid O-acetyltransferase NeuD family)
VRVLVLGAGGHARPVIEALRATGVGILGLLDDAATAPLLGVPCLGPVAALGAHRAACDGAVVAIGDNATRATLAARCRAAGFALPRLVHPAALVSPSASLGEGAQVMARAVVGPLAQVGALALVNTGAIVEHDVTVEEAAQLGPGAVACGFARIGAGALVGAGAVLRASVSVGAGAHVAPGAVVTGDRPGA